MMSRMRALVLLTQVAVVALWLTTTAHAESDHLQCYKVKDPVKLKGIVDVTAGQLGTASGCIVSGAPLFCVPASKTVVKATSNGAPLLPLPYTGPPAETDRLCYKLRCPRPATPFSVQQATDQFGTRTLSSLTASMLCTPAVEGALFCGNQIVDPGEQCDGTNLNGATCRSLGFASGSLNCAPGCRFDTSGCQTAAGLLATGQTTCWDSNGRMITCAGTGQDGETRTGVPLAYTDNGDGTITDVNTGLMWEKLCNDGSVHDVSNSYSWDSAFVAHVGSLNNTSFAGHTDWRLPNIRELASIANYDNYQPGVSPAFNLCSSGCTVLTGSCTSSQQYWSSSTMRENPFNAWVVNPLDGAVYGAPKSQPQAVRAVRGGL